MNKLISRFFWICIFLCAPFFNCLQASGPDQWLEYMNAGKYRAASVEAERIYFQSDDRLLRSQAILARSWALKHLEEYPQALDNLRRASLRNMPDELEYLFHHERTLLHYLKGNWNDARNSLQQLNHFVDDPRRQLLSGYIDILSLIELQQWDQALEVTERYFDQLEIPASADTVFYREPPSLKNPDRAELFSTFIPGAGQIYAGSFGSGLGSAALQISSLAWGGYNLITGYYLTALFTGGGLFQAFYFGGMEQAKSLAQSYNEIRTRQYNTEVSARLLNIIEPHLNKKRRTMSDSPFEIE